MYKRHQNVQCRKARSFSGRHSKDSSSVSSGDKVMGFYTMTSFFLIILAWRLQVVSSREIMLSCAQRVYLAKAEQQDEKGLKCWDHVEVPSCGGRCDSREISDWEFPFKKSHHPVCAYGSRKPLVVRLRHCDPGVTPGTEVFHFIAAENCRCKVCSSEFTSCEWLPPNSTLLEGISDNEFTDYGD